MLLRSKIGRHAGEIREFSFDVGSRLLKDGRAELPDAVAEEQPQEMTHIPPAPTAAATPPPPVKRRRGRPRKQR